MPEVIFNGSEGRIEGRFHPGLHSKSPIALLLHPHPKQGGNMNNTVINSMFKTFAQQGFGVLKFNYRGVGRSEGVYDNGEGELSDAASALDWLQNFLPQAHTFWVGGYSFGALLGMQLLMRRPELKGFIAVSPPANHYDFNFLAPCPVSGQIIQGDHDTYVQKHAVDGLVQKLRTQRGVLIDYHVGHGADHLYTSHLDTLERHMATYLETELGTHKHSMAS